MPDTGVLFSFGLVAVKVPDTYKTMSVRVVIAGQSQCPQFAECCLIADHLSQHLPEFCYEAIEQSVAEWPTWLMKVNVRNGWHHLKSPLVWKEFLMKGSKPSYIGAAADFMEYCFSYYDLDLYIADEKFKGLSENFKQYKRKLRMEQYALAEKEKEYPIEDTTPKTSFEVCISGASCPLTMYLINGLLEYSQGDKSISKIYIYDEQCSEEFMQYVEEECSYVGSNHPGKVLKFIDKIGLALTHADLMIIMDHVPYDPNIPIGTWLDENRRLMCNLAILINASASRSIYIVFPDLGPACFNATVLMHHLTPTINKKNIVVATNDIGLGICTTVAEIAGIPLKTMFSPPVWGFVGISHLADVKTTLHKYNSFEPYSRYTKVRNSTLNIGMVTPDIRTLEYLMYFDTSLWVKVAEKNKVLEKDVIPLNKSTAVITLIKQWLFDGNPDYIVNLGIRCDGSFGLTFNGIFSQPARWTGKEWVPATEFLLPKDSYMKLPYLQYMAEEMMKLRKGDLPPIVPFYPCSCKPGEYIRTKKDF